MTFWKDLFGKEGILSLAVIVGGLGYFVDVFDIVLVGAVRTASLQDLGVAPDALMSTGITVINTQLVGMLLGCLLWGMLADRKGRTYAMFGSITLYSLASLLNAFVTSVDQYLLLRFIGGLGLAGELGPAASLIVEALPKHKRGYGSMILTALGCVGILAAAAAAAWLDWRTCFIIGGVLGLVLLVLRIKMLESGMFTRMLLKSIPKGDIRLLLNRRHLRRYLACLTLGLPYLYIFWVFAVFAPEIGRALGFVGAINSSWAIAVLGMGTVVGDFAGGFTSQYLANRKQVLAVMFAGMFASAGLLLCMPVGLPAWVMYAFLAVIGMFGGNWALVVVTVAEQFGTNIRATVATTSTNLVRIPLVAATTMVGWLTVSHGLIIAVAVVTIAVMLVGFWALTGLHETFGKNLDYAEE